MHEIIRPPENPIEDHLIALLDRGVSLAGRADELDAIRVQMHLRERARLKRLLRAAKAAEARP